LDFEKFWQTTKFFSPVIGPFLVATVTLRHSKSAYSHSTLRTFQMPQVAGGHYKTPNDWEKKFLALQNQTSLAKQSA